ncbi:uncharacterized protein JCM6883_000906 [Sporobolomyces salmoneus]|uniref:uncharacterized protein n=1 Tax=Sporobolomyces salmoneus TaxID=183962 RepID=UPI00317BCC87
MVILSKRTSIFTTLIAASLARAAVTPTFPGGEADVFVAGQECSYEWKVDETGEWKSFDVDLMTGHNLRMTNLTRVAVGLDGTDTSNVKYSFHCPEVDPPAPIYFYQFSLDGEEPVAWTGRFAIAAPNGSTVEAPNAQQLDGSAVPWGTGKLVNNSATISNVSDSTHSTNGEDSTLSSVWGLISEAGDDDSLNTTSSTNASSTSSTSAQNQGQWTPASTALTSWQTQSPSSSPWDQSTTTSISNITGFMEGTTCGRDSQCPEETPCCSEYGFCGTGRNCLAGCNPLGSFQPQACAPVPACVDRKYSFQADSSARILDNSSTWNGDASSIDWLVDSVGNTTSVIQGVNANTGEPGLTLSLGSNSSSGGTTITSTRSLWFGNVTARIKAASEASVVTGFSFVSGTGDEIDFELTNSSTHSIDTAIYSEAEVVEVDQSNNVTNLTTSDSFHDYTVSWLPESITWLVDGKVVQTVSKNSTLKGQVNRYPQTPSRIRFWIREKESTDFSLREEATRQLGNEGTVASISASDMVSFVSEVNVICYPTSLLSNFTFDNTTRSGHTNLTSSQNSTSLPFNSSVPASSSALNWSDLSTNLGTGATSQSSSESLPPSVVGGKETAIEGTASTPSSTVWWTPPVETTPPQVEESPSAQVAQIWSSLLPRRLRRWISLERRNEQTVSAYSYGAVDENGQVAIQGWSGPTTISSDRATGLNMLAAALPGEENTSHPVSSADSGKEKDEDEDDDSGKASRIQKWNDLPTWAHAAIIGGSVLVGLILVVIIGRCFWRRASGSTSTPEQKYVPIGMEGPYDSAVVTPYGLNNNAAYDAPVSASPLQRASTSSSSASKYTNGGYVPSSSLRHEYFPRESQGSNRV